MRKFRVLHLYAGNLYGGIERLLLTLATERAACPEMEPHFGLCFEGKISGELREAGVPVHMLSEVRFSRPWTVWKARRRLTEQLQREPFDAVICHACWPHALFARIVRAVGLPLVYWAHDMPTGTHWLDRRAARTPPDLAIANSRYTRDGLGALFPAARHEILYCPVPVSRVHNRELARRTVREELGAGPADVVIVIACRLEQWKGHRLLLTALGMLRDLPGWRCWIAGGAQRPHEAAWLDELKDCARREKIDPRIQFLGHRSEIRQLLAGADIHCQPNTGPEPFGISFIEALAAGLPLVTTRLGAAPEIVTDDCGLLARPDDAPALAAALRSLIADPARRAALGAAGPARARVLCDPIVRIPMLRDLLLNFSRGEVAA